MKSKTTLELMNAYAQILEELNHRQVARTYNSPIGDYAEWLVAQKLHLKLAVNSKKSYDAEDEQTGKTYQIKARWERDSASPKSRQLSMLRDLDKDEVDYLVIVIFGRHFDVKEAYLVPYDTVRSYAKINSYQNGHRLTAMGSFLKDPAVVDITDTLNQSHGGD